MPTTRAPPDTTQWAELLRAEIRATAEAVVQAVNLTIAYSGKQDFRKEDRIQKLLSACASRQGYWWGHRWGYLALLLLGVGLILLESWLGGAGRAARV